MIEFEVRPTFIQFDETEVFDTVHTYTLKVIPSKINSLFSEISVCVGIQPLSDGSVNFKELLNKFTDGEEMIMDILDGELGDYIGYDIFTTV